MSPETKAALAASIEHWKRLRDGSSHIAESHYGSSCELCKTHANRDCIDCPVAHVGYANCGRHSQTRQRSHWQLADDAYQTHGYESLQFKDAANNMVAFLEGLLPAPPADINNGDGI